MAFNCPQLHCEHDQKVHMPSEDMYPCVTRIYDQCQVRPTRTALPFPGHRPQRCNLLQSHDFQVHRLPRAQHNNAVVSWATAHEPAVAKELGLSGMVRWRGLFQQDANDADAVIGWAHR